MSEILIYQEAEEYVKTLESFDIPNVGSKKWHIQHTRLVKLNMQVHQNLMFSREEYITDLMNTYKKWDVVICDLICVHLFKINILPVIVQNLAERHRTEPIRPDLEPCMTQFLYTIMFHEVVLAELLASTCLDKLPEADHLDDLAEWCMYHLSNMNINKFTKLDEISGKLGSKRKFDPRFPTSEEGLKIANSIRERVEQRKNDIVAEYTDLSANIEKNILGFFDQVRESDSVVNYNVSLTVLSLLRAMLFHKLPMSVEMKIRATRIPILVAQLLTKNISAHYGDLAPWQRRREDGSIEFYDGTAWTKYATNEEAVYKLTMMEAQVWLILLESYANIPDQFTQSELSILESIKGRLNEALIDQLPKLKEYRLYLEQLVLQGAQQEASSALTKQQQKIRDQYGISDDLTQAGDIQLYMPGSILVQAANFYESELMLKLRYWYNVHSKNTASGAEANANASGTFITDITDRGAEEGIESTSVTSFAAVSKSIKERMYTTIAEVYVELMGSLKIEDIADSSSTGVYLDHYSNIFPVCANCGLIARNRCSRCQNVWYCGRKCQKIDWVAGHSKVCKKAVPSNQGSIEIRETSTKKVAVHDEAFDTPD